MIPVESGEKFQGINPVFSKKLPRIIFIVKCLIRNVKEVTITKYKMNKNINRINDSNYFKFTSYCRFISYKI